MGSKPCWTSEELETLRDLWGEKTIPQIACILGRSIDAVKVKSTRLGLGAFKDNSEYLPANQVSNLLGVDIHAVTDYWIPKCGLKVKKISPLGGRAFAYIKFSNLVAWLKSNQDKWDSRRVDLYSLGQEFDWLQVKRKSDMLIPQRRAQKWTLDEDARLVMLYRRGNRIADIAKELNRSPSSVEHRALRIDIWGTGKYIPESERKAKREMRTKKQLYIRMVELLKIHFNTLNFDGYWQKEMCMLWDDVKGCKAGEMSCDQCLSFQRIRPQYCVRCGAEFLERNPNRCCYQCREARKKQAQRKYAIMGKTIKMEEMNHERIHRAGSST